MNKPPIRTVEEWNDSFKEWNSAQFFGDQSDDVEECKRAAEVQRIEEARWDECEHLFEFDEEGECVGLKPVIS